MRLFFLNWQDASHQNVRQHKMPYNIIGCRRDNPRVIKAMMELPLDILVVAGSLETNKIYAIVATQGAIKNNNILMADTTWPNDEYWATNYTTLLMTNPYGVDIQSSHRVLITTSSDKKTKTGKDRKPTTRLMVGVPCVGGNFTLLHINEQQFCAMRDDLSNSLK
jgi:hypothetical protein